MMISLNTVLLSTLFVVITLTCGLNTVLLTYGVMTIHLSTCVLIGVLGTLSILKLYTGKIKLSGQLWMGIVGLSVFFGRSIFYCITDYNIYRLSATIAFGLLVITLALVATLQIPTSKMEVFCKYNLLMIIWSTILKEMALVFGATKSQTVYGTTSFYVFGFAILHYYFFSEQKLKDQLLLLICVLFTLYSFNINFQRGAFIFDASSFLLAVLIKSKATLNKKAILKMGTAIVLMGVFFVSFGGLNVKEKFVNTDYDVIGTKEITAENVPSTLYRAYVYYLTFQELTERWDYLLFGRGFGRMEARLNGDSPHSTILEMTLGVGIIGILIYYGLIGLSLKRSFHNAMREPLYQFSFAFLLASTIYSGFNNINGIAWEVASVSTNLFYFMMILLPYITQPSNYDLLEEKTKNEF